MICANPECKKDFHYCFSCGYVAEARLNCCSPECVERRFELASKIEEEDLLVECLCTENVHIPCVRNRIEENKADLGILLIDRILSDR